MYTKNKVFSLFTALVMIFAMVGIMPQMEVKVSAQSQADALVSIALAEEGYTEGSNNNNKYGAYFGNNNVAWCAYFVSWCARQAGIPESIIKTNAWAGSMGSSKRTGNFGGQYYPKGSITPQKGDIVYYGWGSSTSQHVEIVISTSGSTFTSIGGNTKGNTSTEGVRRHSNYSFTSSQVVGYERPNYNGGDTKAPSIKDVQIIKISSLGYTVQCKVYDNESGINRVQFPTWTTKNGHDDLISDWGTSSSARGHIDGNTVTFEVKISDHNNEYGEYQTHIYAYDNSGNETSVAVPIIYIENTKPTISDVKIINQSVNGYTVQCKVYDNESGINSGS